MSCVRTEFESSPLGLECCRISLQDEFEEAAADVAELLECSRNLSNEFEEIVSMLEINPVKPAAVHDCDDAECCVCFEEIGEKNNCTTACGHKFCLVCLMKSMQMNNKCPMCRTSLLPEIEEYDEDAMDVDEDETEVDEDASATEVSDDDFSNMEQFEYKDCTGAGATPEMLAIALERQGYTMADVLSVLLLRFNRDDALRPTKNIAIERNTTFEFNMQKTVDFLDSEVRSQYDERFLFMEEDSRRHNRHVASLFDMEVEEDVATVLYNLNRPCEYARVVPV
jgi:hypothetical protein